MKSLPKIENPFGSVVIEILRFRQKNLTTLIKGLMPVFLGESRAKRFDSLMLPEWNYVVGKYFYFIFWKYSYSFKCSEQI